MASAGPNYAGTCADDATVGSNAWINVTNAQGTQDNVYAICSILTSSVMVDNSVKLVKGGTISGNDKATGATLPTTGSAPPGSATWVAYDFSTASWGLTLQDTDVNLSTFGFCVSAKKSGASTATDYVKATNFGFGITAGSTVTQIKAEVCWDYESTSTSFVAGTQIATPAGPVSIETICPGDFVFAFTKKGDVVVRRVKSISSGKIRKTCVVETKNGRKVECTVGHKFFTFLGWKEAVQLKEGDAVYVAGLMLDRVKDVTIKHRPSLVYNFKVEGCSTYFANEFAVHNGISISHAITYVDAMRITLTYQTAYSTNMMWRRMV